MERGIHNRDQANFLSSPIFVWWDITNKCNFDCVHCYSRSGRYVSGSGELTTHDAKKVISELSDAGVFYIYFLGGEPFMRPDIFNLLEYAQTKKIGTMINTNGWFLEKPVALRLILLRVRHVKLSLDGATADTHDSFRGKDGAFYRVLDAFRNLRDVGHTSVGAVATISKHNIGELERLVDLAAEIGAHNIQCVPVSQSGRASDNYTNLLLAPEDNLYFRQVLIKKRAKYKGKMYVYGVEGILETQCTECVQKGLVKPDFMGCRAGRTACSIDFNGNVLPCLLVRNPVFGNVRLDNFKDIWDHSRIFHAWRSKHLKHPECYTCKWNEICIRECPLSQSQKDLTSSARERRIRYPVRTPTDAGSGYPCQREYACYRVNGH